MTAHAQLALDMPASSPPVAPPRFIARCRSTGESSARWGACQVCGVHILDVFVGSMMRTPKIPAAENSWTWDDCPGFTIGCEPCVRGVFERFVVAEGGTVVWVEHFRKAFPNPRPDPTLPIVTDHHFRNDGTADRCAGHRLYPDGEYAPCLLPRANHKPEETRS